MSEKIAPPESKRSWFAQLKAGLSRTSNSLTENIAGVLTKRKLDEETLDELEEVLIRADLGMAMADHVREAISKGRYDKGLTAEDVRSVLGRRGGARAGAGGASLHARGER